ncbi:MAG: ATP-binding protein [Deinococcales bacterium]
MLSEDEVKNLITDLESSRVERTISTDKTDKFSEAICAFANDYPNHQKPGYLLIGVDDQGKLANMQISDETLRKLADIRHNGQILPQPAMSVERYVLPEGEVAIVEVSPSRQPPVRYKGKVWIRTGPSKAVANETEERRLIEKRSITARTFDAQPCYEASLGDISLELFQLNYLPSAIDRETLLQNHRSTEQQLASLRLYDLRHHCPSHAAILLLGLNPLFFLQGAYIQYVRFDALTMSNEQLINEKRFSGALIDVAKRLEDFLQDNVIIEQNRRKSAFKERKNYNYPLWALRELLMNAVIHRDYESNAPIHLYEFADRIEIQNPGGLYGDARPENFPKVSDYRNPILAEAMKNLGYVNRFNFGIFNAQAELEKNGNPPAKFQVDIANKFLVTIYRQTS